MTVCINQAKQMGDNLFPVDCLEILKNNYKGRLEIMNPKTIFNKICNLMSVLGDPDIHEIENVVDDYLNN